jgi:4'-phosphopantetheinyl transferase
MRPAKGNYMWSSPPENIQLRRNEVHVWCAPLNLPDRYLSQLAQTLSKDEGLRAKRLHFDKDKRHFIIGRGILRSILGRYLFEDPKQLQFRYGTYGKPYLAKEFKDFPLCFNLAHSHGLAIYALTHGLEIGVDLEYACSLSDSEQMAARFFSELEKAIWFGLPAERKREAFYVYWTRK